jgi:hypothetical protein
LGPRRQEMQERRFNRPDDDMQGLRFRQDPRPQGDARRDFWD